MVQTGAVANNIFRLVEQINITDIHHKEFGYFGLQGIVNIDIELPNPLILPALLKLSNSNK